MEVDWRFTEAPEANGHQYCLSISFKQVDIVASTMGSPQDFEAMLNTSTNIKLYQWWMRCFHSKTMHKPFEARKQFAIWENRLNDLRMMDVRTPTTDAGDDLSSKRTRSKPRLRRLCHDRGKSFVVPYPINETRFASLLASPRYKRGEALRRSPTGGESIAGDQTTRI